MGCLFLRDKTVIASEAKQSREYIKTGLLRHFAPRNDNKAFCCTVSTGYDFFVSCFNTIVKTINQKQPANAPFAGAVFSCNCEAVKGRKLLMQTMKTTTKKRRQALVVAIIMALSLWTAVPLTASADAGNPANLVCSFSIGDGGTQEATIIGYDGTDKTTMTNIDIPTTVENGVPVTAIGASAFNGCTALAEIKIPDSITSIDRNAFNSVAKLKAIIVDPENQYYAAEGGILFNVDKTVLVRYPIGKPGYNYEIPKYVTAIKDNAFVAVSTLAEIIVDPENQYYTAEDGILFDAEKITLVYYPRAKEVTDYRIPDGVMSLAAYAFYGQALLTQITIPANVTSIGVSAFYTCPKLVEVTILNPDINIGNSAFSGNHVEEYWCYADSTAETFLKGISKVPLFMIDAIELNEPSLTLDLDDNTAGISNKDMLEVNNYLPANHNETNGNAPAAATWESSNKAAATVDEDGKVEAVAPGTALITATVIPHSKIPLTASCEVTVAAPEATPKEDLYTLTVDNGKIVGNGPFIKDAALTVIANDPPIGQVFDKWIITSNTGGSFVDNDVSNLIAVFTMPDANATIRATYKNVYDVTVNNGDGSGSYAAEEKVDIIADTAPSGKIFDRWTSEDGVNFASASSATTSFTMPAKSVTVTALYKDESVTPPPSTTYTVTVTGGSGSASYEEGATVNITANAPADGKVFDTWTSSGITLADPTSATTSFTMPANAVTVTATYKDDGADVTDTDGDGVPDDTEGQDGTDPNDPGDFKDTDEDGVPDYVEEQDGTDPTDKNSFKDVNGDGIPDYVQDHQEPLNEINGWVYANGAWKYYIDSVAETGWLYDTNYKAWFYFDKTTEIMKTGWVYDGGIWYYLSGNGAMKTGWVKDDGSWYYLRGNGAMVWSKWLKDTDGSWYYLSGNGEMLTGKRSIGGKAYSFKANGVWTS
jgi:glucan-binding YG repeat protein